MVRTVLSAVLALAIGLMIYLTARDVTYAQWIPALPGLIGTLSFGSAGAWLPSLLHVLGFSLLSATVLPRPAWTSACVAWCAVDMAFELGQHAQIAPWLSSGLMDGSTAVPGAHALGRYFLRGTFDPLDLLACLAGAALAAAILHVHQPAGQGVEHAR